MRFDDTMTGEDQETFQALSVCPDRNGKLIIVSDSNDCSRDLDDSCIISSVRSSKLTNVEISSKPEFMVEASNSGRIRQQSCSIERSPSRLWSDASRDVAR